MSRIYLFLFCFSFFKAGAQKGIDRMIEAEKAFAAYASQFSTKKAFLQFMDSTAIEVENGQPVNGLQLWAKRPETTTVLKWHPQYAEIAASNDFGYTTGPWTFQKSLQDSVGARGQFTTVWHLNKEGEWKFLVDMGVSYSMTNNATTVQEIKPSNTTKASLQSMILAEDAFIKQATSNVATAYKIHLSELSIINHNGFLPATSTSDQAKIISDMPKQITYIRLGQGISDSGDLGFVYGSINLNDKKTAYLRIWRHEKKGWRLALEVLQL